MKYSVAVILVLLCFSHARAQQVNSDSLQVKRAYYLQKRNSFNTLGWVCLGSGLTMAAFGLLLDVGSAFNHGSATKGDGIAVAGELVAFASIPMFIIAHHNKKKAALYISNGSASINNRPISNTNYTSLSLAIKF